MFAFKISSQPDTFADVIHLTVSLNIWYQKADFLLVRLQFILWTANWIKLYTLLAKARIFPDSKGAPSTDGGGSWSTTTTWLQPNSFSGGKSVFASFMIILYTPLSGAHSLISAFLVNRNSSGINILVSQVFS